MAVAFRDVTAGSTVNSTLISGSNPSGLADDDLMMFIVATFAAITISTPSGWTQVGTTQDTGGADASVAIFRKIASSEGGTFTFTDFWPGATSCRWSMIAYSGVDTTTPMDVSPTQNASGFTTTPVTTSITPTTDAAVVMAVHGADSGANPTGTPGSGWTERQDVASRPTIYVVDRTTDPAATVTSQPTMSAADGWANFAIALRPATGGGTDFFRSIADSIGITDTLSKIGTFARAITDGAGITDTTTMAGTFLRAIADSTGITDTLSSVLLKVVSITDQVGITDTIARIGGFLRSITDTNNITDTLSKTATFLRVISDITGVTDLLTAIKTTGIIFVSIADSIGITDSLSRVGTFFRLVFDSTGITDIVRTIGGVVSEKSELSFTVVSNRYISFVVTSNREDDFSVAKRTHLSFILSKGL